MAQIHNTDLTKELKEGAKLQQLRDIIPSQLADKVVPVMEVNPKLLRRINLIKTATAGGASPTVYTTPIDKDFILTGYAIGVAKAVGDSLATVLLTITPDGAGATTLNGYTGLTLTVDTKDIFYNLDQGIKLARGTTVVATKSAANGLVNCTIFGHLIDNPLA